jgi:hypothetical protein
MNGKVSLSEPEKSLSRSRDSVHFTFPQWTKLSRESRAVRKAAGLTWPVKSSPLMEETELAWNDGVTNQGQRSV